MSDREARLPLREALSAAHGPETGCPPPEAYLELAMGELPGAAAGGLSEPERRRLAEHASRCPACAAELELARAFAASPAEAGQGQPLEEDVAYVVGRLEAMDLPHRGTPRAVASIYKDGAEPARPASGGVASSGSVPAVRPLRPRRTLPAPLRMALAATLAAAIGWGVYLSRAPEPPLLPDVPGSGVVRGAEVEGLAPQGEVAEIPARLTWEPVPGARAYRVTLRGVDETVLWQGTVGAPPAALPAAVRARLHPAVAYDWSVEALGEGGETLAASAPARFRTRPSPG